MIRQTSSLLFTIIALLTGLMGCSTAKKESRTVAPIVRKQLHPDQRILVIGHRGASGYRPEHTLASYQLAIDMGADFIEPDLVMTKDGVLIARHENEISGTTDVATKFPKRKTTKLIDGKEVSGWFAEDFTLKEIKTLRAKERLASRDQSYNGQFPVPTFAEVLELVKSQSEKLGWKIGVYPETKHPTYFASIKLPLEPAVAMELKRAGLAKASDPVLLQSFELTSLRELRKLVDTRLVFLIAAPTDQPYDEVAAKTGKTYADYFTPAEMKKLADLLYGLGPEKRLVIQQGQPTPLIALAHKVGLVVHPYTFRSDKPFLADEFAGDPAKEYELFFEAGVDGLFSDFSDHAVRARGQFESVVTAK
jgi:glycerophosphoryl diester phosphodiesterase